MSSPESKTFNCLIYIYLTPLHILSRLQNKCLATITNSHGLREDICDRDSYERPSERARRQSER